MKKSKKSPVFFSFAILFSGALAVQAEPFGPPHHMEGIINIRALMELDLSGSQKVQVKKIINKYREEEKSIRDQLMEARKDHEDIFFAEEFNEENVRQAFRKISPIMENMMVLKAKFMAELKPLLNSDQLELLEEKRAKFSERIKKGMQFRESMIDTWLQMKTE